MCFVLMELRAFAPVWCTLCLTDSSLQEISSPSKTKKFGGAIRWFLIVHEPHHQGVNVFDLQPKQDVAHVLSRKQRNW
jgi:hypothetical protein